MINVDPLSLLRGHVKSLESELEYSSRQLDIAKSSWREMIDRESSSFSENRSSFSGLINEGSEELRSLKTILNKEKEVSVVISSQFTIMN